MIQIKPPHNYDYDNETVTIFLGGSIEMNSAERWQERIASDLVGEDVVLLNPRRDDWDSAWKQDPTPGTPFYEQVIWELDAQDCADLLVYYFDQSTISPITLLELGSYGYAEPEALVVCCPPTYFRYGNVKIFCDRHDIYMVESYDELIAYLKEVIHRANF